MNDVSLTAIVIAICITILWNRTSKAPMLLYVGSYGAIALGGCSFVPIVFIVIEAMIRCKR